AVIHVTYRADVYVRLTAIKLGLRHLLFLLEFENKKSSRGKPLLTCEFQIQRRSMLPMTTFPASWGNKKYRHKPMLVNP
ncbi:hypothetical protein JXM67_06895, partial [candidate division WOR-3 bacterium]|nr:hypothetical protein [candidate division WOR-3 bacterium]